MVDLEKESRMYAYCIVIAIVIGILLGAGALKSPTQKQVANPSCQERCKYETIKPGGGYPGASKAEAQYVWKYYLDFNDFPERMFDTQEDCINHCLKRSY